MTKTIGEKILELRKARSLTQEKLGEQLGISSQAVSKWENGESMPDIMLLPKLCEILRISVDALLEVQHSMTQENIMKIFFDYAKEVGSHHALMVAFVALAKSPMQVTNTTTMDLSNINNMNFMPYPSNGSYQRTTPEHIEVADANGMGFVISNNDFMDKIRDFDVKRITTFFEIFSNEEIMTVISELLHAGMLTKDEIIEKTNYSVETINQVLLILVERGILRYYHDKRIHKDLYTVDMTAHWFHMALTAFFTSKLTTKTHYVF